VSFLNTTFGHTAAAIRTMLPPTEPIAADEPW
jgi:hypothetical protein